MTRQMPGWLREMQRSQGALQARLAAHAAAAKRSRAAFRLECAVTGPGQLCLDVVDTVRGETKTVLMDPATARVVARLLKRSAADAERG